jgi:catechol 2,3-dioxygenase-like lactoylglutathione lyase family enzyme
VRLNHVMFAVADLDRSVGFYRSLGLRQIVSVDGYARFVSPEGDTTLSLESRDRDVHAEGFSVHFDCDDVDATVAALKERGVEFEQDPTDRPYLWREAVVRDPDGHAVFLFSAGENRLGPPWKLD